ncbi:MAG TPA: Zn-dependent hydrolase [Solirubrobacterales bacterium]|nr:Zn-dependent hydrolase [Solirubrobacterales bacterium]
MTAATPRIDAARVIADLRELDRRTGGPEGARRVAWGEEWRAGRAFVAELLAEIGVEPERDEAGNVWAYLPGEAEPALALGSHVDSVPGGGWLDGALGVMAAVGVLRAWAQSGRRPPRTLALVDFADEEGASFGRSLLGSSAFSGTLDPDDVAGLRDASGRTLADALADNGVDLRRALDAGRRRERIAAFCELHIEQGPVLESEGLAVAAVAGCAGVERHRLRFTGQASHAGTTPMDDRRDAGLAAAETALAVERVAREHGGVGTAGALALEPGIATAVAGVAELTVDLRHPGADELAAMLARTIDAGRARAAARGCDVSAELVWRIEPIPFDAELVGAAVEAAREAAGRTEPLTSGALHDAAEVARLMPTAMMFTSSIAGISHAKEEDTAEADLAVAIEAFGGFAERTLARL